MQENKPKVKLTGQDGNIFNLMVIASLALKKANQGDKAKSMCDKIMKSQSYDEALSIIKEYCETS